MKYPYIVIKDGIWYPSGTEVPGDIFVDSKEIVSYSKTEINRMPVSELRELAEKEDISALAARKNSMKIILY